MALPINKENWYLKRDDRTRRVTETKRFENFKTGIILSDEIACDFQCQIMLWLICNTLARWCRQITIQLPHKVVSVLNISKNEDFKNSIQKALIEIDPYLTLEFNRVEEDKVDGVCVIGNQAGPFAKKAIWIDCDGWIAGIGVYPKKKYSKQTDDRNILGASFAACLGCSELFRRANGKKPLEDNEIWYSLWDLKKTSSKSEQKNHSYCKNWEFGHVHQPGCGAIGSSFNYLLALTDWKGSIDLIDFDFVDYSNCNRSLPFTAFQAAQKASKVDVCLDVLKTNPELRCRKFLCEYSDYIEQGNFLKPYPDLILCLANQGPIWLNIQHNLPPVVFHATTTPNWAVNFGRHIPKKEWCILCRFSNEAKLLHRFTPKCGKGAIVKEKGEEPILGVLPFLSFMGAIFILAEMAKMPFPDYPQTPNFLEFSFITPTGNILAHSFRILEDCICRDQNIDNYLEPIKKSKYWYLVDR
jgi:hypothetical protein